MLVLASTPPCCRLPFHRAAQSRGVFTR